MDAFSESSEGTSGSFVDGQEAGRRAKPGSQDHALGVQLYDLIAVAGMQQEQVIAYYDRFMLSQLGMAAQAIDIVYSTQTPLIWQILPFTKKGTSPLESLIFGEGGSRWTCR